MFSGFIYIYKSVGYVCSRNEALRNFNIFPNNWKNFHKNRTFPDKNHGKKDETGIKPIVNNARGSSKFRNESFTICSIPEFKLKKIFRQTRKLK